MSPKRFRRDLRDALLDLHWRQWCALGVSGQTEPERRWVIDPEALAVSTRVLAEEDRRLAGLAEEWLAANRELMNGARLRRIGEEFRAAGLPGDEPPLPPGRSKASRPVLTRPALLLLRLRCLFGMDARADVFGYLLFSRSGNSLSIARDLRLHQRSVYRVLRRWSEAGVVYRARRGYELDRESVPPSVRDAVSGGLRWLDWGSTFLALDRLGSALGAGSADDPYVASSLFRDVRPCLSVPADTLGVRLPRPERYPGAEYFAPFAAVVEEILGRLAGRRPAC